MTITQTVDEIVLKDGGSFYCEAGSVVLVREEPWPHLVARSLECKEGINVDTLVSLADVVAVLTRPLEMAPVGAIAPAPIKGGRVPRKSGARSRGGRVGAEPVPQ